MILDQYLSAVLSTKALAMDMWSAIFGSATFSCYGNGNGVQLNFKWVVRMPVVGGELHLYL